jgi:hypothetical protein
VAHGFPFPRRYSVMAVLASMSTALRSTLVLPMLPATRPADSSQTVNASRHESRNLAAPGSSWRGELAGAA